MTCVLVEERPVKSSVSRSIEEVRRLSDFVKMDGEVYVPLDKDGFEYAYFFDRATLLPYHPITIRGDVLEVLFPSGNLSYVNNLELLSSYGKLNGLKHEQILKIREKDFKLIPSIFDARFPLIPHLCDYHLGRLGEEKQIITWLRGEVGDVPHALRLAYRLSEDIRGEQWLDEASSLAGIHFDSKEQYRFICERIREQLDEDDKNAIEVEA